MGPAWVRPRLQTAKEVPSLLQLPAEGLPALVQAGQERPVLQPQQGADLMERKPVAAQPLDAHQVR